MKSQINRKGAEALSNRKQIFAALHLCVEIKDMNEIKSNGPINNNSSWLSGGAEAPSNHKKSLRLSVFAVK